MDLKSIKSLAALAALAALALASHASAGQSSFTMVDGVITPGTDVSLTIQASGQPGYAYDFIVTNHSDTGIVTGVYFEKMWNTMLSGAGLSVGPADLNPASLSPEIDGWEGSKASHTVGTTRVRTWQGPRNYVDRYDDNLQDGITPGQSQTFSFVTDISIISLGDLEDAAGNVGFGVGIRVQNLTSDPYAEGWGLVEPMQRGEQIKDPGNPPITGVPSPTAAFTGLAMLGLAAGRRRRRA